MLEQFHAMLKAQAWETAKGALRALVAIDGAKSTAETERPYRFEVVGAEVEKFIRHMEDNGHSE